MKFLAAFLCLVLGPCLAMADHQGSVSFDCSTKQIVQFNLEGITFMPQHLASQGASVSVDNNVVHLHKGSSVITLGTLQKPGACSIGLGYYWAFINFTNLNLEIQKQTKHTSECFDVTSDGVYGLQESFKISLKALDSGAAFDLDQNYSVDFNSMESCQAEYINTESDR